MRVPSAKKQLQILAATTERLHSAATEDDRVAAVFDALETLGIAKGFRIRLARVLKDEERLVILYARGDYGSVPIRNLTYRLREPHSVTETALEEKNPPTTDFSKAEVPLKWVKPVWEGPAPLTKSWMSVPILLGGKVTGVLTVDSVREKLPLQGILSVLQPYQYVLASVLSSTPPTAPTDDDLIRWVSQSRETRVLVLGKDEGEELQRLHAIQDILRTLGYEGVLVKEQQDIPELSNEDKVRTLAGLCRFVLLENSFPAGQMVECKICSTNRLVTASLRERGHGSSYMVTDYFKDFDFMREFEYAADSESLSATIVRAVAWAETKINERREYFDSVYPWRVNRDRDA